jgi:hypothetical protein
MAEYIDDNGDSFVDIDDFDLEEEGADLKCPEDDDSDPTIPLSNTPLGTIIEEDEKEIGLFMVLSKKGDSLLGREYKLYIN